MEDTAKIVAIRNEVKTIVGNGEVVASLVNYTFRGLDRENIPKALTEGMLRGYTLKDFLTKKIYATPFWNYKEKRQDYALVQSIADVRTIAMKNGQSGKSEPKYNYKGDSDEILSCSVTVWKNGGDERGYTATVFFKEYEKPPTKNKETGKEIPGMWQKMPHGMIAKVAEMAALRTAFPEDLANAYIEEEFDKHTVIDITPDDITEDERAKTVALQEHAENISAIISVKELTAYWTAHKEQKLGKEFTDMITKRKEELENVGA